MKDEINIIGGGLAGCEAAYQIAKRGIKVNLYEMKPNKFSPAHSNKDLAEIVCSNSFKSNLHTNACGLLKEELRLLDSLLIRIADETSVPAGQALAVDREEFSKRVTQELEKIKNITIIRKEVGDSISVRELARDSIVIIATGPLTSDNLSKEILEITGQEDLHFYDAAAPIISKDSINMEIAFYGNRYEQERPKDMEVDEWKKSAKNVDKSYINLPMNKEEYENFWNELVNAEVVELHQFEKREIFEGCMPVEVMAKRGIDTLRYGPLKPMGFTDPEQEEKMEQRIKGTTGLLALIGSPVGHSGSPDMYNFCFRYHNLDYSYMAFDIKEDQVPAALDAMRLFKMRGCNVTMPCKTAAAQNMDELSPAARIIGAVNTIVNENGKLIGHMTDGIGFVENLRDHGVDVKGKKLVILGAGGAATAIQVQCALDGATSNWVISVPVINGTGPKTRTR